MRYPVLLTIFPILVCGSCLAGERPEPGTERSRISYSVGYQVAGDLADQEVKVVPQMLMRGVRDALEGTSPLLSAEQMQASLIELQQTLAAREQRREVRLREEERAFLAANAGKEGVVALPSGLQYRVLEEGTGRRPTLEDTVVVRFRGTLVDGTGIGEDETGGREAAVHLASVIPGWREALPRMREGGRWRLFVPPDLAFGEEGSLADRTLIYDLELITVRPAGKF